MFWKTFTQLPLLLVLLLLLQLGASALASKSSYLRDSTTEMPSTSNQGPSPSQNQSPGQSQSQSQSQTPATVAEEHFPAVAPPQAAVEAETGLLQPPLLPTVEAEEGLRRRVVTYDQRQEGQYNIRGDLENFMILVIPSATQDSFSLLDLLSKSAMRGGTKSNSKRKHASALKSFYQRQQLQQQQQQQQILQQMPQSGLPGGLPEFIEGRTPYHVDISATNEELLQQQQQHPRLHRQQVDVLPPQLIPMPQLIKPYHLEAEPELIQALPPVPASSSSNNLLEGFNQANSQYYRNSRSLRGPSFLETNRLAGDSNARAISVPLYRTDVARSQTQPGTANVLYPPIDVPAYIINEAQPRNWQLSDEPTPIQPKHLIDGEPLLSFELLGDALADSKALLRDGLARCSPGQRRDSYGACRQVEGY
ncbi:uncharacterized protein LOC6576979 [Drosophila mojavensis]|uniref:DUF4794 domain-containing protein n=1 Tax=Drosophila mojavensis TaxID=7230 RepID=B4KIA4_DROMO|nr:uncharacterized protein LOC6576979 [Drosophila mojavensis]EDW12397.1 uncharacterized protein Dmoj_GI17658 [Drosophila mojavensis]